MELDVKLVITGKHMWKDKTLRIINIMKCGGRHELRINDFLHVEQEAE